MRRRILDLAGWDGLRCTVTYIAIATLALAAQRGETDELEQWRLVIDALLEALS